MNFQVFNLKTDKQVYSLLGVFLGEIWSVKNDFFENNKFKFQLEENFTQFYQQLEFKENADLCEFES